MNSLTLSALSHLSGRDVLDHLDRSVAIPIVDGLQAQGDLIIVPADLLPEVVVRSWTTAQSVPSSGIELLRSTGGGDAEDDDTVGVDPDEGVVVAGFGGGSGHLLSPAADLDHPYLPSCNRRYRWFPAHD